MARVYAPSSCTWTCAKNLDDVYPISPGNKPLKQEYEQHNFYFRNDTQKKHIYGFSLHTAVYSSTEKTTVFSGRLPAR